MPGEKVDTVDAEGRILVGVDGSPSSLSALEWAATQAELTGNALKIVITWDWPTSFGWSAIPEGYDPGGEATHVLEEIVASARKAHPDLQIESDTVEGHPAPVLVESSRGAALLVVGSRGHGEFSGMLLGSVSEHCVSNAHCPVLVYRGQDSSNEK
jgi:nucleotide-binding universal stress UspA family protein